MITSRQQGTITFGAGATTGTATITAVDTTKAVLRYRGHSHSSVDTSEASGWTGRLTLTNATTVTATKGGTPDTGLTISFEVVEYF